MRYFIVRPYSRHLIYRLALTLLAVLLIGGVAACQRTGPRPSSTTPPVTTVSMPNRQASMVIQPNAGGEIALNSGASLAIPPEAVSASTVVNLHTLDNPPAAPAPRSIVGQAYEFSFEGGVLTGIAMLTLPLPANVSSEQYDIAAYRWTGRAWERIASRATDNSLRFGADKPGLFAVLGQWRMADASLSVAIAPADPNRQTIPIQVTGTYRYTAPPQMQHDMTAATLLLKRDSTGGAGQISGNESADQTVAETTLYFKPNPNQADGLINFTYTFEVAPGDVDVKLGSIAQFYAALAVADSAAPTRRLSTGADYTQMLPIQVVGSEVVRPEVSEDTTKALQWHVRLNGETLFVRPATDTRLSLADILAQGGLGEYKISLENELDGKLTPVSNEITVQLALPVAATATPAPGELALVTPGPGTPTVSPFGTMPPTPTRRAGPGSGGVPAGGLGTPGASAASGEPSATPTASATSTPEPTSTRTPLANSIWADKYTVAAGECVKISWQFENIARVTFGNTATSGVSSVSECPQATTTYTLNVTDAGGNTKGYPITITVSGAGTSSISFTASAYQIVKGDSLTLSWAVEGAKEVWLNDSGNGARDGMSGVGSKSVSPGIDTTYTLEVLGTNGVTTRRQINIFVTTPDTVAVRFWADQYTMGHNGCTNLHWSVQNVVEVDLQEGSDTPHGVGGVDSRNVCPGGKKEYTLSIVKNTGDTPTLKKITLLSGAPETAALLNNETIATGHVRDVGFVPDLDPNTAGNQPGYRLLVDSVEKMFAGSGPCCDIPVTIEVTQDQALNKVGEFLDWPINQDQLIEFRALCTNNTCHFSTISDRQYLKLTSN
jgi:hypothetical protein